MAAMPPARQWQVRQVMPSSRSVESNWAFGVCRGLRGSPVASDNTACCRARGVWQLSQSQATAGSFERSAWNCRSVQAWPWVESAHSAAISGWHAAQTIAENAPTLAGAGASIGTRGRSQLGLWAWAAAGALATSSHPSAGVRA